MAVTNLTGYTWVGNNSITTYTLSGVFNINFNSNGYLFKQFFTDSGGDAYLYYDGDYPAGLQTAYDAENGSGWEDVAYKTIDIIDGSDVTNTNLISWLETNGTLTPTPVAGYDVTFVTNGGSAVSPLEEVEELPTPLPTTTKANNIFVGWYYDIALTQRAYAGDELTANVTLYAKWYANMNDFYEDVADAIRSKTSETGSIKHTDFADKIRSI